MTDDRSQQKDQGLSNLSVDPDLLARELAAEDDMDPLDAIQLDDAEQDSSLEIARACDSGSDLVAREPWGNACRVCRCSVNTAIPGRSLCCCLCSRTPVRWSG